MRGDVFQLLRRGVVEINVGVGSRAAILLKRDVLLVVGDVAEAQACFVFVHQRRLERVERHFINVEVARVAFIRREEKRLAILAPAEVIRFRFVARREVAFTAVQLAQVKVTVFVTAPIVGVEEARVVGEIRDGERALFR